MDVMVTTCNVGIALMLTMRFNIDPAALGLRRTLAGGNQKAFVSLASLVGMICPSVVSSTARCTNCGTLTKNRLFSI